MQLIKSLSRSKVLRVVGLALVLAGIISGVHSSLAANTATFTVRIFEGDPQNNKMVSGVNVLLVADDRSNPSHGAHGTTNSSGRVTFNNVTLGSFNVELRDNNHYGRDYHVNIDMDTQLDASMLPKVTNPTPTPTPNPDGCTPTPPRGRPLLNIWPISTSGAACTDYPLLSVKNSTQGTAYVNGTSINASAGDVLQVRLYIHNGVLDFPENEAINAMLKGNISGNRISAEAWANNADKITSAQKGGDVTVNMGNASLSYVQGSAVLYDRGPSNARGFSDSVMAGGASVGNMKGCFPYLHFVTFNLKVNAPVVTPTPTPTPTPPPPAPPVNHPPTGNLEVADCTHIQGWTKDSDTANTPVSVHFYIDGPAGSGGTFVTSTTANIDRSDVGAHGFDIPTPAVFKDGRSHTVYAYAIDSEGGNNPLLSGSPLTIFCPIAQPGRIDVTKNVRNVTQGQNAFVDSISANPNDQVEFQMKVTASNGKVNNVVFSDSIPSRLVYVNNSLTVDGVASGNNLSNLSLGNFTSNQTKTVVIRATVKSASEFPTGTTTLTNTASVTSDSNSDSDSANVVVTIAPEQFGSISITKDVRNVTQGQNAFVNSVNANPNDQVEFQMKVTASNGKVNNVVFSDVLPSKLSYVNNSLTVNGTASGNNLSNLSLGNFTSGMTKTILFKATTAQASQFTAGTTSTLTNTATVTSDSNSDSDSANVVVSIAQPTLACAPLNQTVQADQTVSFTASTTNLNGVVLNWTAPGAKTTTGAGQNFSTAYSTSGNYVITVKASGLTATCNVNVTSVPSVNLNITKLARNVSQGQNNFSKSISAAPQDTVQFQVQVSASGNTTAKNVVVTDTLPAHMNFVSGTVSSVDLGNLNAGSTQTVTFTATISSEGSFNCGTTTLTNTASAVASNANTVSDSATVQVTRNSNCGGGGSAVLALTKEVRNITSNTGFSNSTNASNGDRVEFRLVVRNTGTLTANNVRVSDVLLSGLTYVNGTFSTDSGTAFGNLFSGGESLGNLTSGQSRTILFQASVSSATTRTLVNNATAASDNTNSSDAQATVLVTVSGNINLVLSKRAFNQTQNVDATTVGANAGDVIVYVLKVQNLGNADATNFVFQDDLADILKLSRLDSFGGGSFDLGSLFLKWTPVTIPAGSSVEKTFSVIVNANVTGNDTVMTNVYGNTVNVRVGKVSGVFTAPPTGSAGMVTLSVILALAAVAAVFTVRNQNFAAFIKTLIMRNNHNV